MEISPDTDIFFNMDAISHLFFINKGLHKLCPYSWDPAEHLYFVNPRNFTTLDRFKCSWLATAADIWNGLPADLILQGEACGWRTILKDVQRCICT